jgi:hypothetical protein
MRCDVRTAVVTLTCVVLLALVPLTSSADIEGLYFVTVDPDTEEAQWEFVARPPGNYCGWKATSPNDPGFWRPYIDDREIDSDIDLLISDTLDGEVSDPEMDLLLDTFDSNTEENYFSIDEKDLELLVNYLSIASAYDEADSSNFELFPVCADSIVPLKGYRDETDVYLLKEGEGGGLYVPAFTDTLEDWPLRAAWYESTAACKEWNGESWDCREYHRNSFQVSDSGGNETPDADWPLKAASGASHEFGHCIWESNRSIYGDHPNHGNFNELFASASVILSNPPTGAVGYDKPFAQSLLPRVAASQYGCRYLAPTSGANCPEWADQQDCRTGYTTRALWATYLAGQFHESVYSDDVLSKWARQQDPPDTGRLRRDMCGLAAVFDDDTMYSSLGSSGGDRLCRVFHDHSIAKWVDSDSLYADGRYEYPIYSPVEDFNIFTKNDTDSSGHYNCWEIAVPPIFRVSDESDSTWRHVPGNASDSQATGCTYGWNDPRNASYCGNSYCDSVKVRLWGSYYIGFVADTTHYTTNDDRYLEIRLNWAEGAMNDSTELWVSILKYSDYLGDGYELYLDGDHVKQVLTDQFSPADSVVIVVPDFNEGGSEAAAVVLSLVPTVHEATTIDCGDTTMALCLPRRGDGYPSRDLAFTYSFTVWKGSGGGGGSCPVVEVMSDEQYVPANNVLVGGTLGSDVEDYYVLESPPVEVEGTYRLRLREDAHDLSHFDSVSLLAVDLPEGQELGLVDGRGLVAYRRTGAPLECLDESGASLLGSVSRGDGDVAVLPAGSWIEISLPAEGRAGGGAGAKGKPGHKEDPPLGGRSGRDDVGVLDLTPLCFRERECTTVMPIPAGASAEGGVVTFRAYAPADFYMDELFGLEYLDTPIETQVCALVSARHSDDSDARQALAADDGSSIDLARGETIELRFSAPDLQSSVNRKFVLVTTGRYEHLEGRLDDPTDDERVPARLSASAYPNPFAPSTRIRFNVPAPGGRTVVSVFNIAGRLVRDLGHDDLSPGVYELEWDGRDARGNRVAAGVYFYSIETGEQSVQKKLVLLR